MEFNVFLTPICQNAARAPIYHWCTMYSVAGISLSKDKDTKRAYTEYISGVDWVNCIQYCFNQTFNNHYYIGFPEDCYLMLI